MDKYSIVLACKYSDCSNDSRRVLETNLEFDEAYEKAENLRELKPRRCKVCHQWMVYYADKE